MQEIRVIKGKPQQKLLLINGENEAEFITDLPFSAYLGYRGYLCPQGGERLPLRLKKNVYHTVSLLLGQAEANNLTGVGKFYLELNQKGGFWQSEKGEYQTARAAILSAGNAIPSEQPESIFPPLTVDVRQRTVIIPGGSLQIGIERDHNARRIRFYCPRYYDGHDMSQCHRQYVFYQYWPEKCSDETEVGQYQIEDVQVSSEDESSITFSWLVSQNVTLREGRIAFVLCFKEVDEEGVTTWEWHTQRNTELYVGAGIEETSKIEELYPDLLEQWLSKMEEYEKTVSQAQELGDYAKDQGDYAKTQGDRAKSEADRLEEVDAAGLQDQLDALPGKYVQLTSLTQLTEQNLTLETLNPGNYYALSAVANTFADKPEGVTLAQSYVTVYWDYNNTGNTTKRIELINHGDGRKWYKSYDGTKWRNWIEYTRNEEIADKTKLTQYINWTDLGVPVTSDYATIVNAMINNSVAILPVNSTDNNPNHPTQYGTLEILKTNFGPVHFTFTRPYNGFFDKWCGTYRTNLGFSGWKKITFQDQIDALPEKYVQLTNLTQLTEQNLTLETLNPGNYYALSAVANTFADKPEGVTLAQSYVTVYWDFWTTGNTTKRIELISRGDGRKWYKSYDGTEWGDWVEYARNVGGSPVDGNGVSVDAIRKPVYLKQNPLDLDAIMEPGIYYCHTTALLGDKNLLHFPDYSVPTNQRAFSLEVFLCSTIPVQVLRLVSPVSNYTYERRYQWYEGGAGEGWKEWKKLTYEGHNHNSFTPKDVSGQTLDIQDLAVETPEIEWFRCGTNGGAANISNIPVANLPFFLEKKVVRGYGTGNDFIARFRFLSSNKKEYECWCTVSTTGEKTWTDWQEITFGGSETGTWTPVFRGTTTAGSFTYTDTNEGYYFKVGGYVYIHGKIGVSNVAASPAGAYEVTGLPYSGTPWGTNGITVGLANGGQDESMRRITSGSVQNSVIRFRALTAGNTQQWEASSTQCPLPVGGAFELYFSGWYRTEE